MKRKSLFALSAVAIVAAAAEPERHPRNHHDRAGERRSDGARENVAVLHVRQFVRHHAAHFALGQHAQDARGGGDGRMLRIAAGGERVRLAVRGHVQLRHGHAAALGQLPHDPVVLG